MSVGGRIVANMDVQVHFLVDDSTYEGDSLTCIDCLCTVYFGKYGVLWIEN